MANLTINQIILDAQRMANRVKDLEALGNAVLVEAEGNNRQLESMRQFQDDIDSLNKLSRDKSNSDMVNRINQQNPSIREIRQENRELKACLEDHQRALEVIMHKYREQMQHKILSSRINFKEIFNENLSKVIKEQSEKINEMAAIMQKAASADDDTFFKEIESLHKLKTENESLRELLQISKQFGSAQNPIRENLLLSEDKCVQTEIDESKNNDSIVERNDDEMFLDKSQDSQISRSLEISSNNSTNDSQIIAENNNVEDNNYSNSNNNNLSNGDVTSTVEDNYHPTESTTSTVANATVSTALVTTSTPLATKTPSPVNAATT